ncbi:lipopolysaccharide biosynthesis protein [Streptomyces griseiscabiei]|uniref:Lipopolysaccharide biosynthesis protein n=1 Tax=Streptomyces griseiscabiei TaxID=2993540 RepID=A0ABU4LEP7_9ACTN|nr:lipopolysaccharide biosynthesis protein [Streptomyces griseiscabiei]MBZ3902678.1 lipopolysaccharide biosynthesis protein [Streptomyces griseiscabiei]MDX2914133.1 lipopolysaccharide biosynthesis protein [Streptomyces griseiscabiei]
MSDTTTTTAHQAEDTTTEETGRRPGSGRRLRLPGLGRGAGGDQLFRNAYALMLNTGISAVLGLGFWLAAARYYTEASVGQGSAAIAAMKLLAGLTALTLTGALARFIPVAGRDTGRLIFRTYAGSAVVVALAAGLFLLTLGLWGSSYSFLHDPLYAVFFVLAVVAWSTLTLQDGVLTGLRSAVWVPVGNTVFSAVKLVLLVVFAAAVPTMGVFVSWVAAIAMSVLPLGWLVFRRLIPAHAKATADHARPPSLREIGRFLAGDYTGSLFSLAVVYLVPVIVAAQVSSADNAYFYITTTIGGTVNLLAINMGASLTVEGAHDPARLAANTRAALKRMARIMLPVCGVLFFGAPWILAVFGQGYADAATPLLRWFAVGALLRVVMETYFAVLRAQSRTAGLAWLQGLLCALVLGLTLVLLPRMGLTGAGVAEISSLAVIVLIAAPRLYRVLRTAGPAEVPPGTAPDGDLADLGRVAAAAQRQSGAWTRRLDSDTLALGIHVDFDHLERRPDVRPGPGTPPTGTAALRKDHRPAWAQDRPTRPLTALPSVGLPVEDREPGSESSLGPAEVPEVDAPFEKETPSTSPAPEAPSPVSSVPQAPSAVPSAPEPPQAPRVPLRERLLPHPTVTGVVLGLLLTAALLLYWVPALALDDADLDRMGGLGLISVLPVPTLAGAALLAVVFAALLWPAREHRGLLLITLLATVFSLHALPAVIETEPRFATAWQHLGFIDYIDRTGTAVPDLDARWSWPGFFAAAAFVAEACGITDFTEIIRWWPTAIQLLYLAPMFLLARHMRASWRAKWTGVWVFVLSGWVGQDYFSPQGFTYLLYLVFVAILLVWFRAPHMLWGKVRPGEAEVEPSDRRQRAVLLTVLIALYAATVPAHQLTPFVMLGVLAVLVLTGRSELRGLPILFAVMVAVWLGYLAEPYWSGHFDELFGGVGGVGGNVTSSVSGRIGEGSSTHKLVLYARVALAGTVMLAACYGFWRRRGNRYRERSLLVLTFVPFLGFGMQSYGGEMALRVFMFALPGAALLAGLALFPRTGVTTEERDKDRVSLAPLAALVAGLLLIGGFLVARWGNEPFERVRPGEVAAMEYVYAHDDPTVRLLWLSDDPVNNVTPAMPWGARDMEKVEYVPTLAPSDPVLVSGVVKALKDAGANSFLIINRSQVVNLQMDAGYSRNWESRLVRNLDKRADLEQVFSNTDATIFALRDQPGRAPAPDPGPIGPQVTWTPWSVVGGLAAIALIVLLSVREIVRVAVRPSVRQLRWLQSSFWFSLPLLALLLASLVQRFVTMGSG